ncbi:unnamed protein product, partial [Durusdinium trenchii]
AVRILFMASLVASPGPWEPLLLARLEIDGSPRFRPAPQTPRASHRTSARWTGVAWSLAAACAGRCAGHRAVVRRSGAVEVPEQTRSTGTTAAEARRAAARRSFREVATSTPVEREETWHLPADAPKALQALRGTYYLNGLASCDQGGRLVHPFEAHGFLRSFQFHGDGSITYRGRFVETTCSSMERAAGRPLFRGVFSNVVDFDLPLGLLNAFSPRTRETANLTCRRWPPRAPRGVGGPPCSAVLVASGDNDTPMALDPTTLETLGPAPFPGLSDEKWLAHTRYDAPRHRLVYASSTYVSDAEDFLGTKLVFHEYNEEGQLVGERTHQTSFMVVHDWILTENYYVVPKNPARFHPPGLFAFLSGVAQGTEVFRMAEDEACAFLLIPRAGMTGEVKEIPLDRFFNIFHMGPTYEEEKLMVVHFVAFDRYRFGGEMGFDVVEQDFDPIGWSASATNPPPRLHRLQLDLEGNQMLERTQVPLRDKLRGGQDVPVDMPTFHPLRDGLKARYCYFSGAWRPEGWFPFRSLLKADLQSGEVTNWDAGDGCLVSEPLFLPNSPGATEWLGEEQEDDGWLASVVHDGDAERCRLVLLDARRVQEGPVVTLDMGPLSPWGRWANRFAGAMGPVMSADFCSLGQSGEDDSLHR